MKRSIALAIVACNFFLLAPFTVVSDAAGPPGGLDVTIVNPIPVPVTGDMNATVTGNVNVTNQPGVTIENTDPIPIKGDVNSIVTGDVYVTNLDDEPVPVKIMGVSSSETKPIIINIITDQNNTERYTVPEGKRLQATYISFHVGTPLFSDDNPIVTMSVYRGPDFVGTLGVFAPFHRFSDHGYAYNVTKFGFMLDEGMSLEVQGINTWSIHANIIGQLISLR